MDDHREIWLEPKCAEASGEGRAWCQDDAWGRCDDCDLEPVKYIRADLAHIAGLKEAAELVRNLGEDLMASKEAATFAEEIEARISELEKEANG